MVLDKNGNIVPENGAIAGQYTMGNGESSIATGMDTPEITAIGKGNPSLDMTGTPNGAPKANGLSGIGSTLQGIGALAGAAAGIYDAYNKKKYQDKVFGMEEQRVARATARQDKQQANYDKVFG